MLWQFFSLPGIENGIEYRYFSRYRIEVRNSSIVTTLLCTYVIINIINITVYLMLLLLTVFRIKDMFKSI